MESIVKHTIFMWMIMKIRGIKRTAIDCIKAVGKAKIF